MEAEPEGGVLSVPVHYDVEPERTVGGIILSVPIHYDVEPERTAGGIILSVPVIMM